MSQLTIIHMPPRQGTPWLIANGREVFLGPDASAEDLEREACALFGVPYTTYLLDRCKSIAADLIDGTFKRQESDGIVLLRMQANPAHTQYVAALEACIAWAQSLQARAYALQAEVVGGTRTTVSAADFADLGPAPYTMPQLDQLRNAGA